VPNAPWVSFWVSRILATKMVVTFFMGRSMEYLWDNGIYIYIIIYIIIYTIIYLYKDIFFIYYYIYVYI
jgi:hypothetical protein